MCNLCHCFLRRVGKPGAPGYLGKQTNSLVQVMNARKISQQQRKLLLDRGWLSTQATDFCNALLDLAEVREFPRGKTIFVEGDKVDGIDGIVSGSVGIYAGPRTDPRVLVHIMGPSEWGGGVAPLGDENPRIASPSARSDLTTDRISWASLKKLETEFADFRSRIGELTSITMKYLLLAYTDNSSKDISVRTKAAILRLLGEGWLPNSHVPGDPFELAVTQTEIAELAHVTRNAVAPILKDLERQGAISIGYGKTTILDRRMLRH